MIVTSPETQTCNKNINFIPKQKKLRQNKSKKGNQKKENRKNEEEEAKSDQEEKGGEEEESSVEVLEGPSIHEYDYDW